MRGVRDGVIQLDLKRMNKIIDIGVKNQIAIVEPYIKAIRLQTELWKQGLNVNVVSCGGTHSVLASITSGWGYGFSGPGLGYSGRNYMGAEWVSPTGEIITIGSAGHGAGWFTAEGPGPSMRPYQHPCTRRPVRRGLHVQRRRRAGQPFVDAGGQEVRVIATRSAT
jgi:glycolate oxidase